MAPTADPPPLQPPVVPERPAGDPHVVTAPQEPAAKLTQGNGHASNAARPTNPADLLMVPTLRKVLSKKQQLEVAGVPFGAVVTPCHSEANNLSVVRRPAVRCKGCKGYINSFCKVDGQSGSWGCVLCGAHNSAKDTYAIGGKITSCPELLENAVDYVVGPAVEGGFATTTVDSLAPVIFVVDATLDAPDLDLLKGHLLKVVETLPPGLFVGLITFASSVAVYDLRHTDKVVCDSVSGHHSLEDCDMEELLLGPNTHVAPLHACLSALKEAVDSIRPFPSRGRGLRERPRCFGVAVEVAMALLRGERGGAGALRYRGVGRVLALLGGPITLGPGTIPPEVIDGEEHPEYEFAEQQAKEYISMLTKAAERAEVAVDVLAAGLAAINVPLFGYLTQRTGGCLLLHEGFSDTLQRNVHAALTRISGYNGVLDVYTSPSLALGQVIGPAGMMRSTRGPGMGIAIDEMGPEYAKQQFFSSNACQLNSVEHGQGFCVMFAPLDDLQTQYVYVQVIVSWSLMEGGRLERVITHRLETTASVAEFVLSVSPIASGMLTAKRVILQALKEGAAGSQRHAQRLRAATGSRLKEVGTFLGRRRETSWGFFTGPTYVYDLPPELGAFSDLLYQLVRGPMLGVIAGHPDERALLQTLFLKAGYTESLLILAPRLYELGADKTFHQTSPADLAMTPGATLVLDNGTQVFVWLGANASVDAVEPLYRDFIIRLTQGRFPMPEVNIAQEGSGDARYVASRLVPVHRDAVEEQNAMLPGLRSLTAAQRTAMQARAPPAEDPSMLQWCRHYYVHPALSEPRRMFASLAG